MGKRSSKRVTRPSSSNHSREKCLMGWSQMSYELIPSSKTRLPSSIFDKLPDKQPVKHRDSKQPPVVATRDPRFGPITIDWVDMESNEKGKDKEKGSTGHGKAINESSGNTTLAEGIIHLYRT
ncbi:670_t:CDS:2, partial [Acaulospora colombiana]